MHLTANQGRYFSKEYVITGHMSGNQILNLKTISLHVCRDKLCSHSRLCYFQCAQQGDITLATTNSSLSIPTHNTTVCSMGPEAPDLSQVRRRLQPIVIPKAVTIPEILSTVELKAVTSYFRHFPRFSGSRSLSYYSGFFTTAAITRKCYYDRQRRIIIWQLYIIATSRRKSLSTYFNMYFHLKRVLISKIVLSIYNHSSQHFSILYVQGISRHQPPPNHIVRTNYLYNQRKGIMRFSSLL